MIINYGQSLSVGGNTTSNAGDFYNMLTFKGGGNEWSYNLDITNQTQIDSFYGDSLLLFEDSSVSVGSPVAANAYTWMNRLNVENKIDLNNFDWQLICSTPGYSGASIGSFIKEPTASTPDNYTYYERLLFSVQKAKELSNKDGKTFAVPCLFWVQGEADVTGTYSDREVYKSTLRQLFTDLNTDIKNITGQPNDIKFIIYQMAPTKELINTCPETWISVELAKEENNNIYMGGVMYQYDYSDIWHPKDRTVVGLQAGINAKRIITDNNPYPVFDIKKHYVQEDTVNSLWLLSLEYDVPCPPMRFYHINDGYHNVNGYQPNFGFELKNNNGEDIIISEPVIKRGNTIIIKCSENPTGLKLSYATSGHYGGGNLCDSQNISINMNNKTYTLDNFAVAFKDYII